MASAASPTSANNLQVGDEAEGTFGNIQGSSATEQEHEEMDHARSSSPEMVAVLAPGLESERDGRMDEDQYEIEKLDEGSIQVRDLTRFEGVVVNEPDSSDPTLRNQSSST